MDNSEIPPFPDPDRAGITPAPNIGNIAKEGSLEDITRALIQPDGESSDDSGELRTEYFRKPGQFTLSRRKMIGLIAATTSALGAGTATKYGPDIVTFIGNEINKNRIIAELEHLKTTYNVVLDAIIPPNQPYPWNSMNNLMLLDDILHRLPPKIIHPEQSKTPKTIRWTDDTQNLAYTYSDSTQDFIVNSNTFDAKKRTQTLQAFTYIAALQALQVLPEPTLDNLLPKNGWRSFFCVCLKDVRLDKGTGEEGKVYIPDLREGELITLKSSDGSETVIPSDTYFIDYLILSNYVKTQMIDMLRRKVIQQPSGPSLSEREKQENAFYNDLLIGTSKDFETPGALGATLAKYYVLGEDNFKALLGGVFSQQAVDGMTKFTRTLFGGKTYKANFK